MTYTNFPDGVTSFGIPQVGGAIPPFNGTWYFVDPAHGSDGNEGTNAQSPFATLTRAFNLCVSGRNDVIVLYGDGTSNGTARLSSTLNWNKNATHLIGVTAPVPQFGRARISTTSTATVFSPLVNVTASGCNFYNLSTFYGFSNASTQICWVEAGERNYYANVHFGGMANATAAAQAGSRSLTVGATGKGENVFQSCTIGLDTVSRTAANYNLEFLGGSPRNKFIDCQFPAFVSGSGASGGFIKAGSTSIDRDNTFIDCRFLNQTKSSSTAFTQGMSVAADAGGMLFLDQSWVWGATALETAPSGNIVAGGPTVANTTVAKPLATNW